jgi:hypothetical protein
LSLFSAAALTAVTASTATSTDNRARVTASGLAARELDLVGEQLAASPDALAALVNQGTKANPNPDPAMVDDPDADFPFHLDGEAYRVERKVEPSVTSTDQALCDSSDPTQGAIEGALVTVTVTWASLKDATRPHVARKLFAPHRNGGSGLASGDALITVKVTGNVAVAGATARKGVTVTAVGGGETRSGVTDARGCAVLAVHPGAASVDYTVSIVSGPGNYVDPSSSATPSTIVQAMKDQEHNSAVFANYDPAASLTVTVENWNELVQVVKLEPTSGAGGSPIWRDVIGATAEFAAVYPGNYTITAGDSADPVEVELKPGEHSAQKVVIK